MSTDIQPVRIFIAYSSKALDNALMLWEEGFVPVGEIFGEATGPCLGMKIVPVLKK